MLVYTAVKREFVEHVKRNEIDERILEGMRARGRGGVSRSELRSWRGSLLYMSNVLDDPYIPDDAGVALEFTIPQTSKRIDLILTGEGRAPERRPTAVIVEHEHRLRAFLDAEPSWTLVRVSSPFRVYERVGPSMSRGSR